MKKSKIVKIQFTKPWDSGKGTVYFHDVEFENGDRGQCGLQKELPPDYEIGTEHEYELTPNGNYPNKIKFNKPKSSGGGGFSKPVNNAGFALSYAKDVLIASWQPNSGGKPLTSENMFTLADKMLTWLESKK